MTVEHTVTITSAFGEILDVEELATIKIKNAINNREHEFTIWAGDGAVGQYEPYYVWLNGVPSQIDFNEFQDDRERFSYFLSDSLYQTTLFDLVKHDEVLERAIRDSYEQGKDFEMSIPKEQQVLDVQGILVDEEIASMLYKIQGNSLNKQDIVDFGKLVQLDDDIGMDRLAYLEEPFFKTLQQDPPTKEELSSIEKAYEVLQLNTDGLKGQSLEKVATREREIER